MNKFYRIKSFFVTSIFALFTAAAIIGIVGCDSTGVSDGTLRLNLTDAPFPHDQVDSVNVTIDEVIIISGSAESEEDTTAGDEGSAFTLTEETMTFNLLDLQETDTLLTQEELPAGSYSQIRLIVSDVDLVLANGETIEDVKVPSGQQSGLKIPLPNFTIESDAETELTLDFDVEESFHVVARGGGNVNAPEDIEGFILRPVIKPIVE